MKKAAYTGLRYLEDILKKEKVVRHLRLLRKMRTADPEQIRDYQFKAAKKLLEHAYETTPFYKERMDAQGVRPADIRSLEDFSRLKPVTREDIQTRGTGLISRNYAPESLMSGHSSGSTGEPITYYQDRLAVSAGRAAVLMGWELAGKEMGDKVITLWGNRETIHRRWNKPGSRLKALFYRDLRVPVDRLAEESQFKEILDLMKKQKGGYVFGYAHPIYQLACYAQEKGIPLPKKFDGIFTTAEKLYPHYREIVEEVLGPVYDCYGSREILGMAYQCRERKGYHIIEPNLIFETEPFLDDTREVVVTDLWNFAWPLIRYKISDLVGGEFRRCTCGCTWKTIDTVVGRTSEIIRLPDGGLLHPLVWFVEACTRHWTKMKQVQFARVAEKKFVLRARLYEGSDSSFLQDIKKGMSEHLKGIGEFDVEVVDSFPPSPTGKHRSVVDETAKERL